MTIFEIQQVAYATSKEKGWWIGDPNIPEKLALIHSEVSEALEAYRNCKDGEMGEELADVIIRTLDLASYLGIDMEEEVLKKQRQNESRPYRHGGKRC